MTARRPRTRAIRLSRRWTRIGKLIGYPLFGLLVFVATVYLSLPLDRIKERLERELSQESGPPYAAATTGAWGIGTGMDVRISELDLHLLPVGVSATGVTLHPRKPFGSPIAPPAGAPPSSGEDPDKAKTMFVDSLRISVPVFDLLFGKQAASLRVEAFGGTLTGSGGLGSDGGEMEGALENLVLARIPGLGQLLPLPMTGTLTLRADGRAPAQKPPASAPPPPAQKGGKAPPPRLDLAKAQGQLEIHLDQGTLGDGKAKLKVPGDPFLSQGLTFPKLLLGNLAGKLTVDRGRATFDQVHSRSADAEIWLDGYVELRDPFPQSELHLYLRFKPSAALIAREPTMEILSNAMAAGKRPDGALGFAVTGSLAVPRSRPAKDPPTGVTASVSMGKVEPSARPSMNPGAPAYSPPQVSVATPVPPPPPPAPTPAPASEPTPPVIVRAAEPPPPPPPPAQLPTPPPIPEQQAAPRPEPERKEEARKEPDGVNAPEPPPNFPTNQRGF